MQAFFVQFLCRRKNFLSNTVVVCYMKFSLLKSKSCSKKSNLCKKKHQITFRSAKKKSENRIIKKKKRIKKFRTYRRSLSNFQKKSNFRFCGSKNALCDRCNIQCDQKKVVKIGQNSVLLEWPLFSINFTISQTFRS